MRIKDYIKETTNPFIDSTATHDDSFFYSDNFQSMLTEHIKNRHGKKTLAESIIDDAEEDEVEVADIVRDICEDVYNENKYRYNTLWNTMHLDYNPIENYDRTEEEYTSNLTGEQTFTHNQGEQNNEMSYGGKLETSIKGEQTNINEYGQQNSETIKGEQETANIFGKQKETNIKGEQANVNNFGSQQETSIKGEQTNVNTYGGKEIVNVIGDKETVNSYDKVTKEFTKGDITNVNEYGKQSESNTNDAFTNRDTLGGKTQTTIFGETNKTNTFGAEHKFSDSSQSTGVSSYDDNSDFGANGITTEDDEWIINYGDGSGNASYHPKERILKQDTFNTEQHSDAEKVNRHIDSVEDSGKIDEHYNDETHSEKIVSAHADVLSEKHDMDTDETKQRTDRVTEGSQVNSEEHIGYEDEILDGERTDTKDIKAHTDSITEGERTDIKDVNAHTDNIIESERVDKVRNEAYSDNMIDGKRVDTREEAGYNDSSKIGAREDTDTHGKRTDKGNRVLRAHGNIGVLTVQHMIAEERDIANLNILEIISRDIIKQIACTVF